MASAAGIQPDKYHATDEKGDIERSASVSKTEKGRWERLWPVIACGAGLFSDGYLNNVRRNRPKKRQQDISQRDNITPYPTMRHRDIGAKTGAVRIEMLIQEL